MDNEGTRIAWLTIDEIWEDVKRQHASDTARYRLLKKDRDVIPVPDSAVAPVASGSTSDGYHTFDELYAHREILTAALMLTHPMISWRSTLHHDGTMFPDYFIAGMDLPEVGQIRWHYPMSSWLLFTGISVLERAPVWDGHTPTDVVDRLAQWIRNGRS